MANAIVWWGGGKFSPIFLESQKEVQRLVPGFRMVQGGFNGTNVAASAGTHAGDAADYSVSGKSHQQVVNFITAQRMTGNFASFRTTRAGKWGTPGQGFSSYHIHVVPNNYANPSRGARNQAASYRNGRNGLAGNGYDVGPGHTHAYRSRTWYDYKKLNNKPGLPSTGGSKPTAKPLTVDGKLGPATIHAVQRYIGATQDGVWAPNASRFSPTTQTWQMKLNSWGYKIAVDGKMGPQTIRAIQKHVGATQDGIWAPNASKSSPTTTMLQKKINLNFFPPKPPRFQSSNVIQAYNNRKFKSTNLIIVQRALGITADGYWGNQTQAAYDAKRRAMGYKGSAATGSPDKASLQKLFGSRYEVW